MTRLNIFLELILTDIYIYIFIFLEIYMMSFCFFIYIYDMKTEISKVVFLSKS